MTLRQGSIRRAVIVAEAGLRAPLPNTPRYAQYRTRVCIALTTIWNPPRSSILISDSYRGGRPTAARPL